MRRILFSGFTALALVGIAGSMATARAQDASGIVPDRHDYGYHQNDYGRSGGDYGRGRYDNYDRPTYRYDNDKYGSHDRDRPGTGYPYGQGSGWDYGHGGSGGRKIIPL